MFTNTVYLETNVKCRYKSYMLFLILFRIIYGILNVIFLVVCSKLQIIYKKYFFQIMFTTLLFRISTHLVVFRVGRFLTW